MSFDEEQMKAKYEEASRHYVTANSYRKEGDYLSEKYYQEKGDEAYGEAHKMGEKAKQKISNDACREAKVHYDKSEELYDKGKFQEAKEERQKADNIMEEAKQEQKKIDQKSQEYHNQVSQKMDGLQRQKY